MKKIIPILILAMFFTAGPAYAEGEEAEAPSSEEMSTGDGIVTMLGDETPDPTTGVAGSIGFLQESFQTDLATGAATMSVAITVPPGRKNMQPKLALSYSSNNSNGVCGMGWAIPANYIQRSTKDGIPSYDLSDTFLFMSSGSNAELVNIGNNEYRAKIESAFMKYVYEGLSWTVYDKTGTRYLFGSSGASRVANGSKVFAWYLDKVIDVYGNYLTYIYEKAADGQIYLKEIKYTGGEGLLPDKSVVFNYATGRPDKLYSYRSGWEIATTKLLSSIHVNLGGSLVWRYEISYTTSSDTGRKLLQSIRVYDKIGNSLPPKTFTYQRLD
ncbi:MAG: hypothetical protein ISS34_07180 [Candidatus Omnitrophica bacterium]|nr:hypothetical protein [Candidatus Omnitrophota bacterium]